MLGRVSVSMDPLQNGYDPGQAAGIIWNRIFANDWEVDAGVAETSRAVPGFCYGLNSKADGSTCNYDNECQSTHCGDVSHLCSECETDGHCGSQQACVAGACVGTCGNGTCEVGFGELCSNCSDCACGSGNVCSGGICVAGCTGDEQYPFGQYCAIGCCGCSGPNPGTCQVRKPAGAQCCRTGECWITGSGQPSPCVWSDFWQTNVCQ